MKIGVCSLGCDKNRVDSENMLAYMQEAGHIITPDPSDAEIIVVNTCGFIDSAKKEAIDTILEMAEYKKQNCKYLIVSGCLSQRYMQDLCDGFDEVDAFIGTSNYHNLPLVVARLQNGEKKIVLKNDKDDRNFTSKRVLTTPCHYAYLKIAEGCDNRCTYCAIPSIRGKFTSRPIEELVAEATTL
ncbi:MAG: 30S ribosomal protein S12 methylthiotransferase RimO, partial [Clostridia bacterium]